MLNGQRQYSTVYAGMLSGRGSTMRQYAATNCQFGGRKHVGSGRRAERRTGTNAVYCRDVTTTLKVRVPIPADFAYAIFMLATDKFIAGD